MRKLFKYIIYLSLIFLIYYLYKFDYLIFNDFVIDKFYMFLATLFLWGGFFFSGLSWWNALRVHKINVPKKKVIISHGLYIFAKYIPGKIWVILGRAAYISERYKISLQAASFISLKEQFVFLWVGFIISYIPMLVYFGMHIINILIFPVVLILTLVIFSTRFNNFSIRLLKRIIKKEVNIPVIGSQELLPLVITVFFYWVLWIISFYFVVKALIVPTSYIVMFAFPVSACIGLLAIIFPGGIGVREGIMVEYLVLAGIPVKQAVTLAIISRLWFLTGEIFIFLLALVLRYFKNNKQK